MGRSKTDKLVKALEIIIDKNVDLALLKLSKDLDTYNVAKRALVLTLTKEEFSILKEIIWKV